MSSSSLDIAQHYLFVNRSPELVWVDEASTVWLQHAYMYKVQHVCMKCSLGLQSAACVYKVCVESAACMYKVCVQSVCTSCSLWTTPYWPVWAPTVATGCAQRWFIGRANTTGQMMIIRCMGQTSARWEFLPMGKFPIIGGAGGAPLICPTGSQLFKVQSGKKPWSRILEVQSLIRLKPAMRECSDPTQGYVHEGK